MRFGVRMVLAAALVVALACGGEGEGQAQPAGPEAGAAAPAEAPGAPAVAAPAADDDRQVAPDFALEDLQGQTVTMAGLRGKTVVIDFWATWCPPCIFQIPILNSVQARHADAGVVVLGVSVDTEGRKVVKPYAEENDIRYTVLLGDESLARKFGAPGFPAMAIVTPDGRIDSMHVGLIEEEDLDAALAEIQARGPGGPGPS